MNKENIVEKKSKEFLSNLRELIKELQDIYCIPVISIIYNPYKQGILSKIESPGYLDDAWYLNAVIQNSKIKKCNIILDGKGGDFKVGYKMASTLPKRLKKFFSIVPMICGSALFLLALKSDILIRSKNSIITQ